MEEIAPNAPCQVSVDDPQLMTVAAQYPSLIWKCINSESLLSNDSSSDLTERDKIAAWENCLKLLSRSGKFTNKKRIISYPLEKYTPLTSSAPQEVELFSDPDQFTADSPVEYHENSQSDTGANEEDEETVEPFPKEYNFVSSDSD